ncbi:MAG TPA: redoxin domain-containing protein [Calditrichaeota bacterium]|nr:redoxin domain-containing protein [Calditrichota bacterium]
MAEKANNKMWLILAVTALIVVAIGYFFINNNSQTAAAKTQQASMVSNESQQQEQDYPEAPDFTLPDLDGNDITLSDFRGQIVFVNFWATWCGPCRMEIPHFIELIDKYGDDFVVLGVALDPREFDKVPGFAKKLGINYPVVYDKKGVSRMYGGIQSIPTTFVVNREGKVVEYIVGSRPKADFERIIKSWL